ncbi:MAG: hypothetical protein ACOY94_01370 [Bacillota bacterium]
MRLRPPGYYELRIVFGLPSILAALLFPAYTLFRLLLWKLDLLAPSYDELLRAFEVVLPLGTSLAAAHLMVVEREERVFQLRLTYPEPRWRLPLVRASGALLVGACSGLLGALILRWGYGPYEPALVTLAAVAPTIFLVGVSLFAGNVSGNYWVPAGGVIGYWFLNILAKGHFTGPLFLFQRTWPSGSPDAYVGNQLLLAGTGLALLCGNTWLYMSRQYGK